MTITEFLEARIAEDEAAARGATAGPWTLYDRGVGWEIPELPEAHDGLTFYKADAFHVSRWDPARVLAECAAKRAILDEYTGSPATFQIIAHMAAIYSDHPDYDKDWAL